MSRYVTSLEDIKVFLVAGLLMAAMFAFAALTVSLMAITFAGFWFGVNWDLNWWVVGGAATVGAAFIWIGMPVFLARGERKSRSARVLAIDLVPMPMVRKWYGTSPHNDGGIPGREAALQDNGDSHMVHRKVCVPRKDDILVLVREDGYQVRVVKKSTAREGQDWTHYEYHGLTPEEIRRHPRAKEMQAVADRIMAERENRKEAGA